MSDTRRRFLKRSALGLAAVAAAPRVSAAGGGAQQAEPPAGMPPAFGTGPGTGPAVTPATFAAAEKLVQVDYTPAERAQAAGNWRMSMAPLCERRTGPRRVALDAGLAPASRFDPVLPGVSAGPPRTRVVRSAAVAEPLPVERHLLQREVGLVHRDETRSPGATRTPRCAHSTTLPTEAMAV